MTHLTAWNSTYQRFTLADHDGETYDQLFEGIDNLSAWTADDVRSHAQATVDVALGGIESDLEDIANEKTFPLMGYTTAHTYESADDYVKQRTEEARADLAEDVDNVIAWFEAQRADEELDAIVTITEAAELVEATASTIKTSIHRNYIRARKSGDVWLMRRADVLSRWGKPGALTALSAIVAALLWVTM